MRKSRISSYAWRVIKEVSFSRLWRKFRFQDNDFFFLQKLKSLLKIDHSFPNRKIPLNRRLYCRGESESTPVRY
jgi:hypothetical protein